MPASDAHPTGSTSPRRIGVLLITALEVLLILGLFAGRVASWYGEPWVGMTYFPEADSRSDDVLARGFGVMGMPSGLVVDVAPGSPASDAGLLLYDELVTVGGLPIGDLEALAKQASEVRPGDVVTLELRREQDLQTFEVVVGTGGDAPFFMLSLVTSIVVALAFLGFGLLVYLGSQRNQQAVVFHLICGTGAAMFLLWALWEIEGHRLGGLEPLLMRATYGLLLLGFILLATLLGNLVLHLALIYPRRRPVLDRWPRVLVWVHTASFWPWVAMVALLAVLELSRRTSNWLAVPLALGVAVAWFVSVRRRKGDSGWFRNLVDHPWRTQGGLALLIGAGLASARWLPETVGVALLVATVLGLILFYFVLIFAVSLITCIALWRSYRESGLEEKRQVSWPLWGTFIVFVVPLLVGAMAAGAEQLGWLGGVDSPWVVGTYLVIFKAAYVLIPASFAFGLLKYRLLEIDLVIGRTITYGGLVLFVASCWLGLAELARVVVGPEVRSETLSVGAAALAFGLAIPVRSLLWGFVDRRFFRITRDSGSVRERLADAATRSQQLGPFLTQVATEVQQALGSTNVAVFVAHDSGNLRLRAKVGLSDDTLGATLTDLGEGPQVRTLDRGDRAADPGLRRIDAAVLARARLAGRVVGAVTVGRRISRRPYSRSDELFVAAVADQLALAIRRVEELGESAEMAQARAIQQALVPREIAEVDGLRVAARWQPAREIGGDAYDVLRFDDHRLAVAIGDVAGKGLPAALLMSGLQAALKAVAGPTIPPDTVAEQVRRVVCQNLTGGRFVTFFYALIDRRTLRLSFANLGHCPPLLARGDGSVEPLAEGAGVMTRLMAETPIAVGERSLALGDRLLLFTDGVSEARSAGGEDFGEERIAQWLVEHHQLGADQLVEGLAHEVEAFAGTTLADDLTLVAVTVEPEA